MSSYGSRRRTHDRAAIKELNLNYHNAETILFTLYPYSGNSS